MENYLSYLGQGLQYPIQIDEFGRPKYATSTLLINQSIESILSTPIGSRFGLREYGSLIHTLIFEPNDSILKSLLINYISTAISEWEKRIKISTIEQDVTTTMVKNIINYNVLGSNVEGSMIYPFYRQIKN